MAVNARTEKFQHLEVFGKPALFTNGRIARDTVPKGWYERLRGKAIRDMKRTNGRISFKDAMDFQKSV